MSELQHSIGKMSTQDGAAEAWQVDLQAETAEEIEARRKEWRERKRLSRERQRQAAEAEARENVGGPIEIFCNECGHSSVLAGYWKRPGFDFESILQSITCVKCGERSFVEADEVP